LHSPAAGTTAKKFLRSLYEESDDSLNVLDLIDRHLSDLSAAGEINDVFGKSPGHTRATPFAHANAWWAYNRVLQDASDPPLFLYEASEIGYKRGKGNKYQPRPNNLFASADSANPYATIIADDPATVLGQLRAHVANQEL
jgi:hypothetical protein